MKPGSGLMEVIGGYRTHDNKPMQIICDFTLKELLDKKGGDLGV